MSMRLLTLPWIDFIFELDLLIELEHLGRGDDQTVLGFVVFDLYCR